MSLINPRVSIGLPVYNGENFLRDALDSLLVQTFTDFELIISDNASTDRTQNICQEYAAKDSRIRYHRNKVNLGAARNYNITVELAKGEYLLWAAHDDIFAPAYLERCVNVLDRYPNVSLCYPKALTIDAAGNGQGTYSENLNFRSSKPHERFYQILTLHGWMLSVPSFGLRRLHQFRKTGLHGSYPHADRVFLAHLALFGELYEVPEYLFYRRVHPLISTNAHPTDKALLIWYDPKNAGKDWQLRLRRYIAYVRTIGRSDLSPAEQLRCYFKLFQFFLGGRSTRQLPQPTLQSQEI